MSRELRIDVGVLAEKRKASSQWAEDYWLPTAVVESHLNHHEGDVLYQTDDVTRYFMGYSEIYCHAKETEAYIHNFESKIPALYVVLRKDDENTRKLSWYVHTVTASPYEAQDYSDSAEDIVERVTMPLDIAKQIMDFIDIHHVDEEFKKRKRKDFKEEARQFGKEPIFLERDRPKKNGGFDA
jgi:hypothetical protein